MKVSLEASRTATATPVVSGKKGSQNISNNGNMHLLSVPYIMTLIYLYGDQLGSASAATDTNGSLVSQQNFDPWGNLRAGTTGTISQTDVNYTGQVKDGSGLLYYHARYYDPFVSRFVSPDSVVPGSASRSLTVDFHEPGFATNLAAENSFTAQKGFWFQLRSEDRQKAKNPMGPANPQALNRYSYALNNPLQYTDPTGHSVYMTQDEANDYIRTIHTLARHLRDAATDVWLTGGISESTLAGIILILNKLVKWGRAGGIVGAMIASLTVLTVLWLQKTGESLDDYADLIQAMNTTKDGVVIQSECQGLRLQCKITVINRHTTEAQSMEPAGGLLTMGWWKGMFDADGNKYFEPGRACTAKGGNPGAGNFYDDNWCS